MSQLVDILNHGMEQFSCYLLIISLLIVVSYTDARALDIILMGKSIPVGKANKFGLVDHAITKDETLLGSGKKWAERAALLGGYIFVSHALSIFLPWFAPCHI
jgi:hypothetical protein